MPQYCSLHNYIRDKFVCWCYYISDIDRTDNLKCSPLVNLILSNRHSANFFGRIYPHELWHKAELGIEISHMHATRDKICSPLPPTFSISPFGDASGVRLEVNPRFKREVQPGMRAYYSSLNAPGKYKNCYSRYLFLFNVQKIWLRA